MGSVQNMSNKALKFVRCAHWDLKATLFQPLSTALGK